MRKRRRKPLLRRLLTRAKILVIDVKTSKVNAEAARSARYVLEDVPMNQAAELTGLPLGVISAAYDNIFYETDCPR